MSAEEKPKPSTAWADVCLAIVERLPFRKVTSYQITNIAFDVVGLLFAWRVAANIDDDKIAAYVFLGPLLLGMLCVLFVCKR